MLSYQHSYHAGNLADVHKHAILASIIDRLTHKDKPLSYIETHSGRGLYDLNSAEALKTGEAQAGILRIQHAGWFSEHHPYARARHATQQRFGVNAYPGSPLIASHLLRTSDVMHLAECHRQEHQGLVEVMGERAHVYFEDGFKLANRLCPPMPRRGLIVIDPSYELDEDYRDMPRFIRGVSIKWNVGVIMLWYPLLASGAEQSMVEALSAMLEEGVHHQVHFSPAKTGHGMVGSGVFILRLPYGLETELSRLGDCYASL